MRLRLESLEARETPSDVMIDPYPIPPLPPTDPAPTNPPPPGEQLPPTNPPVLPPEG